MMIPMVICIARRASSQCMYNVYMYAGRLHARVPRVGNYSSQPQQSYRTRHNVSSSLGFWYFSSFSFPVYSRYLLPFSWYFPPFFTIISFWDTWSSMSVYILAVIHTHGVVFLSKLFNIHFMLNVSFLLGWRWKAK